MTTLPTQPAAIRTQVAEATVTVLGPQPVTSWTARYFGPWWPTTQVPVDSHNESELLVTATIDSAQYQELADRVGLEPHQTTSYAREPMLVTHRSDGTILAVSPSQRLAYRAYRLSDQGRTLDIIGCETEPVATATARLTRETVRGALLRAGWCLLHASAVTRDGRAVLTLGGKGAGKTTTAMTLVRQPDWQLLANDRVFLRPDRHIGALQVLPWPAAVAVGLGLLDALGWTDIVRGRLDAGDQLHPTQDPRITQALLSGSDEPLWDGHRELKAQIWPHQLVDWFGVDLSRRGDVAALLFPTLAHEGPPRSNPAAVRAVEEADWLAGASEDRYPDHLELAGVPLGGTDLARDLATAEIRALLHQGLILTRDVETNARFLAQTLGDYLKTLS
ncbi:phosphoenolpyruvate carboxykinase (ATP) [Streptomyces mayteni]